MEPSTLLLRIVQGVFCIILLVFAVFQYTGPDSAMWFGIYALPALLAALGALRPDVLYAPVGRRVLLAALMLSVAGMVYFWPTATDFWSDAVWTADEETRRGLGMMMITAMMLIVSVPLLWNAE